MVGGNGGGISHHLHIKDKEIKIDDGRFNYNRDMLYGTAADGFGNAKIIIKTY